MRIAYATHLFATLFAFTFATGARAQLRFDKPTQEFSPDVSDTKVVARFAFVNDGNTPITITDIDANCDCTTAELRKRKYAPGEKGEIVATFTIGRREGEQQKIVTVYTDQAEGDFPVLKMVVHLPQYVQVRPKLLVWIVGDARSAKTIEMRVEGQQVKILTISSREPAATQPSADDNAFVVTSEETKSGYVVRVTPRDTSRPIDRVIAIETDFPPDAPRVYEIVAKIVAPAKSGKSE